MRMRFPDLRTLPSSTVATLSCSPIVRRSTFFPLYEKAEVRAGTCTPGSCASALMISSETPSEKYSFDGSPLMLANGSTATDRWLTSTIGRVADDVRLSANLSIVGKRSVASRAIAVQIATSTARGTLGCLAVTFGGGFVKRWTRID